MKTGKIIQVMGPVVDVESVSYTHLDVYKRQELLYEHSGTLA